MIIQKLTASFGMLQNKSLVLAPGLNIIEAPNESGKSTWAAFLRVMLYGIDSSDRDKRGYLADKNRYSPWSGAPMEGTMVLEAGGKTLIIERSTARANAPMARFSAKDAQTGEVLPELTGETAGYLLTGVEEEVFVRSAFIRQAGLTVDQSPALERRIAALVSSGEEETSYSEAESRLRAWQNRRRHNKSGLLPQLETERRSLEEMLERIRGANRRIADARAELERLSLRRTELERELNLHRQRSQSEKNARLLAVQKELEATEALQAELQGELNRYGPAPGRDTLRALQGELSRLQALRLSIRQAEEQKSGAEDAARQARTGLDGWGFFENLGPEEAWEQAKADQEQCAAAERQLKKRPVPLILLGLLALLAYAGTAAIYFLEIPMPFWLTLAFSVALSLLSGALLLWWNRRRVRAIEISDALLARYGVTASNGILEQAAAYRAAVAAADQRCSQAEALKETVHAMEAELKEAQASLLEKVNAFAPSVSDLFGISAALSRALELWEKLETVRVRLEELRGRRSDLQAEGSIPLPPEELLPAPKLPQAEAEAELAECARQISELSSVLARNEGEQASIGDPAILESRREAIASRCEAFEQEYAAISLAQEALKEAHLELQARFSPALNERAGEILMGLTCGRYSGVSIDRSFQTSVREERAAVSRSVLNLSQGTADQLYLAVRLAICELALPAEKAVPLVLDDALTNFDDRRMRAALDYLIQAAKHRQILLFTCHERERTYCSGNPAVHIARAE